MATTDHYLVKNNSSTNKLLNTTSRQTFDEFNTKSNINQKRFKNKKSLYFFKYLKTISSKNDIF